MDSVSDRDYAIELLSNLSILMMHLSRFSEEIILWCSWEFKFVDLDDAYSTGSSIMPQKKNPDVAELVRGKTGRVYGDLITLLTMMKGLPLAYNKDMQEDKDLFHDGLETVLLSLTMMERMVATLTVHPEKMRQAVSKGFLNATEVADYLVAKGVPFRDAHGTFTEEQVKTETARCLAAAHRWWIPTSASAAASAPPSASSTRFTFPASCPIAATWCAVRTSSSHPALYAQAGNEDPLGKKEK